MCTTKASAFLVGLLLVVVYTTPSWAGRLFPPENAPGGTNACSNGETLTWTGNSVVCQNPTKGVKIACPRGQVLTGIDYGKPVCEKMASTASASPASPTLDVDITGPNIINAGETYTLNWTSSGYKSCRIHTACPGTTLEDQPANGRMSFKATCSSCTLKSDGRFVFAARCFTAEELAGRSTAAFNAGGQKDESATIINGCR